MVENHEAIINCIKALLFTTVSENDAREWLMSLSISQRHNKSVRAMAFAI
jgi:hypothetical protein